jgi:integrase
MSSDRGKVCVWHACAHDDYGRILRLLILTGQRKSEIGNLSWSEIDFERLQIELPGSRTKNKRSHLVPLSDQAITILRTILRRLDRDLLFGQGAGGFSGWSKSKERLDARLPTNIASWTVHDIRRSVVTHMGERGFAEPHVVEAIVNHISGTKAGVAGVYNRAAYANEKRRALELWAEHLGALITKA